MAKDNTSIEELFSRLAVYSEKDEHEGFLDCANKILAKKDSDQVAKRLKVTALIKLDRFKESYKEFQNDHQLKSQLPIHLAYTVYKLGKYEELPSTSSDRAIKHILAQAAYKQEDFDTVERIYNELQGDNEWVENEQFDLSVNQSAVAAQKALNGEQSQNINPTFANYDQVFNTATIQIGLGNYDKALELLQEAKMTCSNSDLSAEDIESDIAQITTQAAYVYQLKGDNNQAKEILDTINGNGADQVMHVAANNKIVLDTPTNPHTALLNIDSTGPFDKLSQNEVKAQVKVIGYNRLILQRIAGRDITRQAKKFCKKHPEFGGPQALALPIDFESSSTDTQVSKMRKLFKSNQNLTNGFVLAHLYCQQGKYTAATSVLETVHNKLGDNNDENDKNSQQQKYSPGLISALINLYKIQTRDEAIVKLLSNALDHWTSPRLIQMASAVLASAEDETQRRKAHEHFIKLYQQDGSIFNTAGVLAGNAAGADDSKLPSIDSLISNVDASQLYKQGIEPLLQTKSIKRKLDDKSSSSTKSNQKRIKRLPKDYDPSKTPDPERWIPKRDRSYYKPTRKEKKKANNTQGGGIVDTNTESGITSGTTSTVKTGSGSSSSNKKKNKKKGKK